MSSKDCICMEILVHTKLCPDKRKERFHFRGYDDVFTSDNLELMIEVIREDLQRANKELEQINSY